jgi:predicted deacetylase
MNTWLEPALDALGRRASPISMFIRDDDAGWEDERLFNLIDAVHEHGVAIDLAAIPAAVTPSLGRTLRGAIDRSRGLLAVHQHGFAHTNHEAAGKKCEFGPSRPSAQQREDIAAGRRRLEDLLGEPASGIFMPPWNRCTATTAAVLVELGFRVLSRDDGAPPLGVAGLTDFPVHLDWTGRCGSRLGVVAWGQSIAGAIETAREPIGLMLHHAVMTTLDRRLVGELLDLLGSHPAVHLQAMRELCGDSWSASV